MTDQDRERLTGIVRRLRAVTGVNFQVNTINTFARSINGFACYSNDAILITPDCLMLDDDELAAVLSHELSHLVSPNREEMEKLGNLSRIKKFLIKILFPHRLNLIKELLYTEELYCDANGVQIIGKAGFDPGGMLRLFYISAEICKDEGFDANYDFQRHPSHNKRIASVASVLRQYSPS